MTATTHSRGTATRRTASGIEPRPSRADAAAREAAVAALLHRVSGGLNNAAMAFELASSSSGEGTVAAGLAGVNQAARAIALLGQLLLPDGGAPSSTQASLSDIVDVLRSRAGLRKVALHVEGDLVGAEEGTTTPALAIASLLDGLDAIAHAPVGASVAIAIAHTQDGPRLRASGARIGVPL